MTDVLFQPLLGRVLASVALSTDRERVTFVFVTGPSVAFQVEGDCCSRSWIEHLEVPSDVAGAILLDVVEKKDEVRMEDPDDTCLQVYQTTFRTSRGDIDLEYRNSSNGYYGGYLVAVST